MPPASAGLDFPGGHAGASLKPLLRGEGGRTLAGFPRRTRRGLIEAGEPPVVPVPPLVDFPGGHAGASLKPRALSLVFQEDSHDFPGGHAGASLKHAGDGLGLEHTVISPADTPGPH